MEKEVKNWLKKIDKVKKGDVDLSRDEDLSIALMNLVSLEEHFYFSAMKTENEEYLNMLKSVRDIRRDLLGEIVKDPKGEEWCISKHLLASSMRLIEVGTKELSKSNNKKANKFFKFGFDLYSLFFAINLKLIKPQKLSSLSKNKKKNYMEKFSNFVKKSVDCCKEW